MSEARREAYWAAASTGQRYLHHPGRINDASSIVFFRSDPMVAPVQGGTALDLRSCRAMCAPPSRDRSSVASSVGFRKCLLCEAPHRWLKHKSETCPPEQPSPSLWRGELESRGQDECCSSDGKRFPKQTRAGDRPSLAFATAGPSPLTLADGCAVVVSEQGSSWMPVSGQRHGDLARWDWATQISSSFVI